MPALPERLVIIGGGVIGLELGSVYARLGTEVHVVEYQNAIIPTMDRTMGKELQRAMKKIGVKFHLSHGVKEVVNAGDKAIVKADNKKGEEITWEADYCLVAVGRKPYTEGLGLDKAGIALDDRGHVEVDGHLRTAHPHIYAIGDVVKGAMLAHKAEEEGIYAVEHMAGQKPHLDHNLIPGVVYVARGGRCGPDGGAAESRWHRYETAASRSRLPVAPRLHGHRRRGQGPRPPGDRRNPGRAHLRSPRRGHDRQAVVAMEYRASAEDIARMSHAHPTFTEALKEAALAATGDRALHI